MVPATEPTEWCSPLHYVLKKDGSIHVVNDLRQLNMATKRPAYPMTTAKAAVEGIPSSARFFSTLDASSGYWQIPLEEESQLLTTFITPWGRFCYTRATMGLVSAGDYYNEKTDQALADCRALAKIVDDVLVHGKTEAECMVNTAAVLETCLARRIKLGRKKAGGCARSRWRLPATWSMAPGCARTRGAWQPFATSQGLSARRTCGPCSV